MKKVFLLLGLFLLLALFWEVFTPVKCSKAPVTSIQKLEQLLDQIRKKYNISAIALSVHLPGGEQLDLASGVIEKGSSRPVTPGNLFQVGSLAKSFTAALILQQATAGKLKLDDLVGQYFPKYPRWKNISIRQLLNHTSGIYSYSETPKWFENLSKTDEKIWSPSELLDIAYRGNSYFSPGEGWHYSNTNYVILGLIVEKVTGKSFADEMNKLFSKHHLNQTYYLPFVYPEKVSEQVVHGYYNEFDMTFQNLSWLQAAGALVSNPHDMLSWANQLHKWMQAQELVSITTGEPTEDFDTTLYTSGMFRMNSPQGLIWFAPGLTSGYQALWALLPCSGISYAYAISSGPAGAPSHREMMEALAPTLFSLKTKFFSAPSYCVSVKAAKE